MKWTNTFDLANQSTPSSVQRISDHRLWMSNRCVRVILLRLPTKDKGSDGIQKQNKAEILLRMGWKSNNLVNNTGHNGLSMVGYDCFRSDHLAITDGVPESRRRDPAPSFRRYTPVRYNRNFAKKENVSLHSEIFKKTRLPWMLGDIFMLQLNGIWINFRFFTINTSFKIITSSQIDIHSFIFVKTDFTCNEIYWVPSSCFWILPRRFNAKLRFTR